MLYDKNLAENHAEDFLYGTSRSSFADSKTLSLSLNSFIIICLSVDLFEFILLVIYLEFFMPMVIK